MKKYVTVSISKSGNNLAVHECTAPKFTRGGEGREVTQAKGPALRSGQSARELEEWAEAQGYTLAFGKSVADTVFYMRDTRTIDREGREVAA